MASTNSTFEKKAVPGEQLGRINFIAFHWLHGKLVRQIDSDQLNETRMKYDWMLTNIGHYFAMKIEFMTPTVFLFFHLTVCKFSSHLF